MTPTADRPGLLISIRDADEAVVAWQGGADVIDVKEPLNGSLGAPDPAIVRQVVQFIAGRSPISVAAGELLDYVDRRCGFDAWQGIDFIKLGLAGCDLLPDWPRHWQQTIERIRGPAAPVAVVYADWRDCQAPRPEAVLATAEALGAPALLVDTFDKTSGHLFNHWPAADLARFVDRVRSTGRWIVLAGSLRDEALKRAIELRPDIVAVRGAVCDRDRCGRISQKRVCEIQNLLRSHAVETSGHANRRLAQFLPAAQ